MFVDNYKILGVHRNASSDEIEQAFVMKKRTLRFSVKIDVNEKLVELERAYKILKNPTAKIEYDRIYDDQKKIQKNAKESEPLKQTLPALPKRCAAENHNAMYDPPQQRQNHEQQKDGNEKEYSETSTPKEDDNNQKPTEPSNLNLLTPPPIPKRRVRLDDVNHEKDRNFLPNFQIHDQKIHKMASLNDYKTGTHEANDGFKKIPAAYFNRGMRSSKYSWDSFSHRNRQTHNSETFNTSRREINLPTFDRFARTTSYGSFNRSKFHPYAMKSKDVDRRPRIDFGEKFGTNSPSQNEHKTTADPETLNKLQQIMEELVRSTKEMQKICDQISKMINDQKSGEKEGWSP